MFTHNDQLRLFSQIAKRLKKDITCYAFGGNAMMFYGYKEETKDVDLVFETIDERSEFTRVIELQGFQKWNKAGFYIPEKLRDKHAPVVYWRDNERIDLFVKKIFQTVLSERMKDDVFAVHEFREDKNLTVKVLRKEILVILKAVTERRNDFEDILTLLKLEKNFDWEYLLDEVLWQYQHGDGWVLLDVHKVLKELQEHTFIPEDYLKRLERGINGKM